MCIRDSPRSASPSGRSAPAKSGRKLLQVDYPQRKVLLGPGNGHLLHSPAGFSFLLDSKPVLTVPGAPPPSGRSAPAKTGRKLPQADCPQRKVLPGPGDRLSALLPCRFFHPAGRRAGFDRPWSTAPLGEGSPGQGGPETPPGRLSTAEGSARPGQPVICSTPLPVFPSYRTASWFWPSQGHHPRSSRRQSGQSRPGTPPSRSSAAEDPAGSGQPAACSPAGLPTLPGGESVSARPRGTTARAGDTQARVTLNRLLDQLSAAADPVGPCQSALFPPGRGLKRGTPVLLSLPPSIIAAGPQRGAAGRGHPAAAPLPRAGQKAAPSL